MTNAYRCFTKRLAPILAAGMLLQASSCALDTAALTTGLVNTIASNIISSLEFGTLGVGL